MVRFSFVIVVVLIKQTAALPLNFADSEQVERKWKRECCWAGHWYYG